MKDKIYILFTMDVEPLSTGRGSSGPVSLEEGMRAVGDYQNILAAKGYNATYFVHPEVAYAQPEFFTDLRRTGSAIGLHLHTTKFRLKRQVCELGGLAPSRQKSIISMAAEMFESSLGFRPNLFRPGCFSANDFTYKILYNLGFTGGGISIPGRIWTKRYCVWSGAYPYAHLAHEAFRQKKGELPFVDIPLSVDLTPPLCWNPVGFYHYPDLRPGGVYDEEDEVQQDRHALLRNILEKMKADNPPVKTIVIDVHNDRDFKSEDSQAARDLRNLLETIGPECRRTGLEPQPSTYEDVVKLFFG